MLGTSVLLKKFYTILLTFIQRDLETSIYPIL